MDGINGIVNILKPPGMTSFDVVAYLRGLIGIRKIGHTGTLDPLAVGVLPVCIGNATKAIEFLMDKDKLYRAELTLGTVTDTQDSSGKVLSTVVPESSDDEIEAAVNSFTGQYHQIPPMYSALRVDGKRLYELARDGIEIERQHREVEVYSVQVLDINRMDGIKVLFDVHCSKGTYIRTLCADIGERLGCGGHMSFLLRKRAGPFDITTACTLEDISQRQKEGTIQEALMKVESAFDTMPGYILDEKSDKKFRNGMHIVALDAMIMNNNNKDNGENSIKNSGKNSDNEGMLVRVYSTNEQFIALGTIKESENGVYLKVKKFF